jgi:predicted PhzF superfamily epimerase YddE/YHI9
MTVSAHQVVTFAGEPFRGNPAFAVTLERPLADNVLFNLCAQLREDVLAVLVKSGREIELRCVTSAGPHPGAGHATHAAAWVALNRLRPGERELSFRLENGDRRNVRADGDKIAVDWPIMPFGETDEIDALAAALGRRPVQTFGSAFGAIALYASPDDVADLAPDLDRVARLDANTVIVTAPASRSDFVIRVFAPKLGLPEDPVCGTAHRIVVPLWAERLGKTSLVSHQLSARTGELFCELRRDIVTIAGLAAPFLEGVIRLPG